jgi:hypothetical protein
VPVFPDAEKRFGLQISPLHHCAESASTSVEEVCSRRVRQAYFCSLIPVESLAKLVLLCSGPG